MWDNCIPARVVLSCTVHTCTRIQLLYNCNKANINICDSTLYYSSNFSTAAIATMTIRNRGERGVAPGSTGAEPKCSNENAEHAYDNEYLVEQMESDFLMGNISEAMTGAKDLLLSIPPHNSADYSVGSMRQTGEGLDIKEITLFRTGDLIPRLVYVDLSNGTVEPSVIDRALAVLIQATLFSAVEDPHYDGSTKNGSSTLLELEKQITRQYCQTENEGAIMMHIDLAILWIQFCHKILQRSLEQQQQKQQDNIQAALDLLCSIIDSKYFAEKRVIDDSNGLFVLLMTEMLPYTNPMFVASILLRLRSSLDIDGDVKDVTQIMPILHDKCMQISRVPYGKSVEFLLDFCRHDLDGRQCNIFLDLACDCVASLRKLEKVSTSAYIYNEFKSDQDGRNRSSSSFGDNNASIRMAQNVSEGKGFLEQAIDALWYSEDRWINRGYLTVIGIGAFTAWRRRKTFSARINRKIGISATALVGSVLNEFK